MKARHQEQDIDLPCSIRIVAFELRLQPPIPQLDICLCMLSGSKIQRVPVISIFGSTKDRRSVCLHIHKVFPYFYIPYANEFPTTEDGMNDFLQTFGKRLEIALNERSSFENQRVFNLQLVSAKSVYGYYDDEQIFIKIILYNPRDIPKAGEILQSGEVFDFKVQPFETHVPFFLQFKMDYNLFGMDIIELQNVTMRPPLYSTDTNRLDMWMSRSNEVNNMTLNKDGHDYLHQDKLMRLSTCEVELDAMADDILNIHKLDWRLIDEVDDSVRLVQSLNGMWTRDMSTDQENGMKREVRKELSSATRRIRQRIKQLQDRYKSSENKQPAPENKYSCAASIDTSQNDRKSSLFAANALVTRQSICTCPSPSPLIKQEFPNHEHIEQPAYKMELVDDNDMAVEMPIAAEDEDHTLDEEQEIRDILDSFQESDEDTEPEKEIKTPVSAITQENSTQPRMEKFSKTRIAPGGIKAIFVPVERPPHRETMESFLATCKNREQNKPPFYGSFKDEVLSGQCWQKTPCFTESNDGWKMQRQQFKDPSNSDTVMEKQMKGWRYETCISPPGVIEVAEWLKITKHQEKQMNCDAHFDANNRQYGARPDSPDYDETSSFYHTPLSLKALSYQRENNVRRNVAFENLSEISGPSTLPLSSRDYNSDNSFYDGQQLIICSIEIHAASRGNLLPDPVHDAVHCIVITATTDSSHHRTITKLLIFHPAAEQIQYQWQTLLGLNNVKILFFSEELNLILHFVQEVLWLDPDLIVGFEMTNSSLGYLVERCFLFDIHLLNEISRMRTKTPKRILDLLNSDRTQSVALACSGRILLDLWKVLRSELKLNIYTLENCVAEVLKIRIPKIEQSTLHSWFSSSTPSDFDRCLRNYVQRSISILSILDELDIIGRTGEMARLYGIDFFSVLSRGSQYRVESMLIRLAHSQNFLMLSPSKEQVYNQPAMECLPLVLEPDSQVHCDPVIVLDFQSLYPSLVIAYNLCFTTICAKNELSPGKSIQLGVSNYTIPECLTNGSVRSEDFIISPNGMCFLPPSFKKGLLPRLLQEILRSRIMVKKQMKTLDPSNKLLMRCLNARQFGLKMIANVTYGYTAAGFSGRMPMAELADAIVQSGRQTLMNAIELIEGNRLWNAKVVYGDSVAEDTPLLLRIQGQIVIRQIQELGEKWEAYHQGKQKSKLYGVESWTETGWTQVKCVIRHQWDVSEPLYKVKTPWGCVLCTGDHSLLTRDGKMITPKNLSPSTSLMHSFPLLNQDCVLDTNNNNLVQHIAKLMGVFVGCYHTQQTGRGFGIVQSFCLASFNDKYTLTKYYNLAKQVLPNFNWLVSSTKNHAYLLFMQGIEEELMIRFYQFWKSCTMDKNGQTKVPDFVFNSSTDTMLAFWKGFQDGIKSTPNNVISLQQNQCLCLGILVLKASLEDLKLIRNKSEICFPPDFKNDQIGIKVTPVFQKSVFVYDLMTTNHHFHAGVGSLIVHNTDSVFVKLADRTKEAAFRVGKEIADAVTKSNPAPVELKLEKIYHPCVLLTKKHYVGFSFESPDQNEPIFDAKGIETVRRDSCSAVAKIMTKTLTILFETKDLNKVRKYLERQWEKILTRRVNLKDFIFAKEVRMDSYRSEILPPAAEVALVAQKQDPRKEPLHGQRIPYIVIQGHPGCRLIDLVVDPQVLIQSQNTLKLNSLYYITKQINPALDRILALTGVTVSDWFTAMSKSYRSPAHRRYHISERKKQRTIDVYFPSLYCHICDEAIPESQILCPSCQANKQKTIGVLTTRQNRFQSQLSNLERVCVHCCCYPKANICRSLDCELYFERSKLQMDMELTNCLFDQIEHLF